MPHLPRADDIVSDPNVGLSAPVYKLPTYQNVAVAISLSIHSVD